MPVKADTMKINFRSILKKYAHLLKEEEFLLMRNSILFVTCLVESH